MPTYTFRDSKTGEVFERFMKIAEREDYLRDNPHIEKVIDGAAALGDPIRLGIKKPDDAFRDILRNINKKHYKAKVNTF